MKNILFYFGHVLVLVYIFTLFRGMSGINHILISAALVTYFIAIAKDGRRLKAEREETLDEFTRSAISEYETPYVFVMKNNSHQIKKITLPPSDIDNFNRVGEHLYLLSGFEHIAVDQLLKQMQNKPRNYCRIEVFGANEQLGMPVMYTDESPAGASTTHLHSIISERVKLIYCDVDLKKGNKLDFNLLPNTFIVVQLFPYRKTTQNA